MTVGGKRDPMGIAVSRSNLYVASWGAGTIGEYTTSGGTVIAALVSGLNYPSGIAVTPEPSTLALLVAGALGLVGYGWRRRVARTAKPAVFDQQHDAPAILSLPSHSSPASAARRAA